MRSFLFPAMLVCVLGLLMGSAAADGPPTDEDPSRPARAYFEEGQRQEAAGRLVEATRMYKLALTLTPRDPALATALEGVQAERRRLADAHFQRGEQAYAAGDYRQGRIRLLTALRLWPDHAAALEKLREQETVAAPRPVRHIVRKGETLTTIARQYYGDARKYPLLVRYNRITDAQRIRVGQAIMVPPLGTGARPPAADVDTIARIAARQVANYRASGREMLQAGDLQTAIAEFRKVYTAAPDDPDALADLGRAYDAYARRLWERNAIDQAKAQFEACIALRDSCPDCPHTAKACLGSYKERLYDRGMAFFQNEDPRSALAEWQTVHALDPDYRDLADYMRKARQLSEQLGLPKEESTP